MGARLARYTRNQTYADWANKVYDWINAREYIDEDYNVFDGGHVVVNCTAVDKAQFSYNAATLVQGAAFTYNFVSAPSSLVKHLGILT